MFSWLGYGQSQEKESTENKSENQEQNEKNEVKSDERTESKTSESTEENEIKYAKDVAKNVGSKWVIYYTFLNVLSWLHCFEYCIYNVFNL